MGNANENAAGARRPTAKVSGESVKTARVMVDAFHLASKTGDSTSILNGIFDGLGSLVYHDASGVYVIEADGKRLRHSLVRGCDPSVPQLQAPFDDQGGVVGQVLATGEPGPSLQAVVRLLLGLGSGLLGRFYASIIALLAQTPRWASRLDPFAAVGRLALTKLPSADRDRDHALVRVRL